MIGAMNNDNVNENDNLYIIALRAIQDSNFKFQDFLYDWSHIVITIFCQSTTEDDSLTPALPRREGVYVLREHYTFLVS
jgi:hypothetical protein